MAVRIGDVVIGRDSELDELEAFVGSVPDRAGGLIVSGEAGAGKTTLWRAGLEMAEERLHRVLVARPAESEVQLSFAALRDILDTAYERVSQRLPAPQRHALAIALLHEQPGTAAPDPGAVAAGLLGALRLLSSETPVLLAIDDVQWLDAPSSRALEFVVRRLGEEPIGLLLTRRTARNTESSRAFERAFGEERLARILVGPLSAGALHLLLRTRLGTTFTLPVLRRMHETSGGNPFYALELARALIARGGRVDPGEPFPVPVNLRDLIRNRLAMLPKVTHDTLFAVAALAQPTVPLLTQVCGENARSHLERAASAQVLELDDGHIRFAHPLLASTVYSEATPVARRKLHGRLADMVTDPEERGRHVALAAEAPSDEAAAALDEASRRAWTRGAPLAAAELADQALRLTPLGRTEDTLRRAIAAAGHYFEAGDPEHARSLLEHAVAEARPGEQRAEVLAQLARVHGFGADLRTAAKLYREALVNASRRSRTYVEAERGLAVAQMRMLDDLAGAARHAHSASAVAERLESSHHLAESLSVEALIRGLMGRPGVRQLIERAKGLDKPAVEAAAPSNYFLRGLWGPRFHVGVLGVWLDDLGGARCALEGSRQHAVELGDESALPLVLRWLGYAELLVGRWTTALELALEGEELAVQTGQPAQRAVLVGLRALVLAHRGEEAEARAAADEGLRLSDATGAAFGTLMSRSALGLLELSLENNSAVHEHLWPLQENLEAAGVREPGAMRFVTDEIEALIALGRHDDAETLLGRLERHAGRLGRASARATAGRCRALLEAAQGRLEEGLASGEEALAEHDRLPLPFERARTLLALGALQRRAKRKTAARESLAAALEVFEELGALVWAGRARAELSRIGGRRTTEGLTPTERRIVELVAQGRSNKEVGAALFVTAKTVETTLSRIYRKLGVHSRTELAHRLGTTPDL